MTKKEYEFAANWLREFRAEHGKGDMSEGVAVHIEEAFVDLFNHFDSKGRFDRARFLKASRPDERKNNCSACAGVRQLKPNAMSASDTVPAEHTCERECSEGGLCEFTPDLEYDSTGETVNCSKCGEKP